MDALEFWVGTYALAEEKSIYRCTADFNSGVITCEKSYAGVSNPTFLLMSQGGHVLYAVEECMPEGRVCAFDVAGGCFEKKAALPSGAAPCHLCIDNGGRYLFAANYMSGDLAVYSLDEHGLPDRMTYKVRHFGAGTDPVRQEAPHVHFSVMKNDVLYVTDLGLDTVSRFLIDDESETLKSAGSDIRLPRGSGVRHLCFHPERPEIMFVICELTAQIMVIKLDEDGYKIVQSISTLPGGFAGKKHAAAIKISEDGKFLFASNRGHDSIAVFEVRDDGTLTLLDIAKTGGSSPRDFALAGNYIIAANQDSGEITVLQFEPKAGKIGKNAMRCQIPNPVCITPIK